MLLVTAVRAGGNDPGVIRALGDNRLAAAWAAIDGHAIGLYGADPTAGAEVSDGSGL
jgi:hypothetical protein